jgi:uncharacterized protein (UPF0335 family)
MTDQSSVSSDELKSFIDRIERLNEERAVVSVEISSVYTEAKSNGFDAKVIRQIIADRKQDASERQEQEAIYDLYMQALEAA